jgi:hypothetical protein
MNEKEKYDFMKKSRSKKELLKIKDYRLPIKFSYMLYIFLFLVFFIMSTTQTILVQIFINKYQLSAALYKDMSEMSYNIPGPFALRDMNYNFIIFPFYNNTHRLMLLDLFAIGLEKQQNFITFLGNFKRYLE